MKKLSYLFLSLATLAFVFVSCDREEKPNVDDIVEDGFYVVGEATASTKLVNTAIMAAGINEKGQVARAGMYEKYIALEGGKSFSLLLKEGVVETKYGAILEAVDLGGVDEQPNIIVQKGVLAENATLQVEESGLYHIVLDLNLENDLDNAQILIAPVEWGMRGDINGWGFSAMTPSAFNKESMTFTLEDVEIAKTQKFKFAYGGGWKIELTDSVKANTNLGKDLVPGGDNITLEENAVYDVILTWTLKQGNVSDNYSVEYVKKGNLDVEEPTTLFMIGAAFGDWKWESDGVVEMIPVKDVDKAFWCVRYIAAGSPFKWAPTKAWSGDFAGLTENTGYDYDKDGNAIVAADGIYMIYIDQAAGKIAIEPAAVYGIGDAFGGWDEAMPTSKFTVEGQTLTATTTAAASVEGGGLRIYAASSIATTAWWSREFVILDGKIEYRGAGDDQARVAVTAGKKVVLDFTAGTGSIN